MDSKKINAKISILINRDNTRIEVYDDDSSITFLEIILTPEQLSSALSRMALTPCESVEVRNLDRIGKKMENINFEVITDGSIRDKDKARELIKNECPEGWLPDLYLGSQNSFSYDRYSDKTTIRTIIRRWV